MLSENLQELLSAYVDGELASAEYSRVMSALRESEAAREYVKELRSISSQLKALPEIPSPFNFTKQFLQKQQGIQLLTRKRRRITAGMAAAAGLLLATTAWFVWSNSTSNPSPNSGTIELTHNDKPNPKPNMPIAIVEVQPKPIDVSGLAALAKQGTAEFANFWQQLADRTDQSLAWLANAETRREELSLESSASFLAAPSKQLGNNFKTIDVQLPLLVSPTEFNLADLQARWTKKGLFILDVSSNDTVKSLNRLMEAAKKQGLSLVIDEEVAKRLEKKLPAMFMVYLENANEEKLQKVLQSLDHLDRWHDALNAADMSAQSLFFYALEPDGRKQLAKGLGVRPERLQFVTTPTGSRLEEQQGVVLAYYPTRVAESISPDVRKALEKMPGPRGDGVSVVFLLRQMK